MSRSRSRHTFTIFARKDSPHWAYYFYVDGKRVQRISIYPRAQYTREQAQAAIDAVEAGVSEPKALTVRWMAEHVTERLRGAVKLGEIRERTFILHRNNFRHFIAAFGPDYELSNMNRSTDQRIKEYCLTMNLAPNSINSLLSTVHMAFKALVEEECIPRNPLAGYKPVPAPVAPVKPFSASERERFIEMLAASDNPEMAGIIRILNAMAMRVNELRTIERKDIDIAVWRMRVPTFKQKGEHYRYLSIPESVRGDVLFFLGLNNSEYPFRVRTECSINQFVKRYAEKITGKRITTHSLRHTAATCAIEAGINIRTVQRILGHASLSTTERYYAHDTAQDETLI